MFKLLKEKIQDKFYGELVEQVRDLALENTKLRFELASAKKDITAEQVIKQLMGKGLHWYDHNELEPGLKYDYVKKAKEIVNDRVFINEVNYAVSDLVEEIAIRSKDFGEVRDLRMTINGLQLLKERLENIE